MPQRIVSYQLAQYLEEMGVEIVFGLCGHTNIAFLDALAQSKIRFITSRHEQVAAHMADGYARVTGKPGVLLTHLGPGLTNAATGVANAALDSIPMVVIAGDVPAHYFGRHPHQEVNLHIDADQYEIYRPFCKRIWRVERPAELPRVIERAFHTAQSGRSGVVLVDVPMDVFSADLPEGAFTLIPPLSIGKPTLERDTASAIARALVEARSPVIHVGGGVLLAGASAELAALVEWLDIPVTHTLMGKGALPDTHPLNAGMTGFWGVPVSNELARTADLILGAGTRFAEADSSSWDERFTFAVPPSRLIHIDIDPAELGRNFPTEIGAVSDIKNALVSILSAVKEILPEPRQNPALRDRIKAGRSQFASRWAEQRVSDQYPLKPDRILADVRHALPEDGLIVTDVGWNKNGVGQQFPITIPGTFITPGGLATMGFGPAAALGVKLATPERKVVALVGDGAFSSNMSVLATAAEAGIPVTWVVMDNMAFGTIALLENHHYKTFYGTVFERDGQPYQVQYAQVAEACGLKGIKIEAADQLLPALNEALASNEPVLIHVPMENVPTPTPGHWNINDIYRKGA
jgi:acetolactate synthase I/II/III large subunit